MSVGRFVGYLGVCAIVVLCAAGGAGGLLFFRVQESLPARDGTVHLPRLRAPVTVVFDRFAVPIIDAGSREDAFRALGYVTASERLFQMDLMRRKSAGRLAEIFGERALALDRRQRALTLERAAGAAVKALPAEQRRILAAYAGGINAYLQQARVLPPEFWALRYRPEPWRPEDSMLVALGMFQSLNWIEDDERMLTVMERCLPGEVAAFLTPDEDAYSSVLMGKAASRRPAMPVPAEALSRLTADRPAGEASGLVQPPNALPGSNAWAVGAPKTKDGRAILANDMHLGLSVPGTWYRAALRYGGMELTGLTLPGVPLVVVGTSRRIAWGFTNTLSDTVDFVLLEADPDDSGRYLTPDGWKRFEVSREKIRVKSGADVDLTIQRTIWGPVFPESILGRPVALKWSALDPGAINLDLLNMDRVLTLELAMAIMNRAGVPTMNAVMADERGRIGWTLAGKFPKRRGFDGAVSRSWANGQNRWDGFLPPWELPRIADPPEGFLATANQRTVGADYPHILGHNFESGYRAYRIAERLREMRGATEAEMLELQMDTRSEFYEFYRSLALSVLTEDALGTNPFRAEMRDYVNAWNGRADRDSLGLPLLVEFRGALADRIFSAYLWPCRKLDEKFRYRWFNMDTPLKALLAAKDPRTLPLPEKYPNWDALLLSVLDDSAHAVLRRFSVEKLNGLTWGRYNRQEIEHPFSRAMPLLGRFLNLPATEMGGCSHCINVASRRYGVSERLVVSPAHPGEGMLHLPGGQSGHPFSAHYADQFPYWVEGRPLALVSEAASATLRLSPEAPPASGNALRNSSTD